MNGIFLYKDNIIWYYICVLYFVNKNRNVNKLNKWQESDGKVYTSSKEVLDLKELKN